MSDIRELLRTASRLAGGKTQVPEELLREFCDFYGRLGDKEPVLQLLAQGLGVDGEEVEASYGAWQPPVRHPQRPCGSTCEAA